MVFVNRNTITHGNNDMDTIDAEGDWLADLKSMDKKLNAALTNAHLATLGDIANTAHFLCEFDKRQRELASPSERAVWVAYPYCCRRGR